MVTNTTKMEVIQLQALFAAKQVCENKVIPALNP
jgi:hypothetical protein